MARLILHIGQYKTGSTSLQASLLQAREALIRHGVLYPRTGLTAEAHGALIAPVRKAARTGGRWDAGALLAEVAASGCETVILSCEGLSGSRVDLMEPELTARTLALLAGAFAGWQTRVIWYWRRQDEAVESRIVQTIKGKGARTEVAIEPYLAPHEALDYPFFHATIAGALPDAAIEARSLAPEALAGGEVVGDFLAAIGLAGVLTAHQIRRVNITPPGRQLGIQLALNRLAAGGYDIAALQRQMWRSPSLAGPGGAVLTAEQRRAIMEHFRDSNTRFLAEVVPPGQRAAAAAYLAAPVSEAVPNAKASAEDLAKLLIEAGATLGHDGGRDAAVSAGAERRPPVAADGAADGAADAADAAMPSRGLDALRDAARGQAVRVYLGAHKTASTHLQDLLVYHRATLANYGTTVSHPGYLRGANGWLAGFYTAVSQHQATGRIEPDLRARLRLPLVEGHDWLISEENILGIAKEAMGPGSLYAWAPPRFPVLAQLFSDRRVEAFMSLRSYDGFFASIYGEVVRNDGFVPWAQFRAGIDAVHPRWSWIPTIEALVAAFGAAQVTLWDFADFTALQPQLVSALSGIDDSAPLIAAFPVQTTRPSLSARTIEMLDDLTAAIGREAALKMTEQINDRFAIGARFPRFQPWSPEEAAALRQAYAADLAEIRRRWPALRWLSPPPEGQGAASVSAPTSGAAE